MKLYPFSGLCFGGPLHMQQLTHETQRYCIPTYRPVTVAEITNGEVDGGPSHEYFEYHHEIGLRGGVEIDFWLPKGRTASWAIQHMFDAYINNPKSPRPNE